VGKSHLASGRVEAEPQRRRAAGHGSGAVGLGTGQGLLLPGDGGPPGQDGEGRIVPVVVGEDGLAQGCREDEGCGDLHVCVV